MHQILISYIENQIARPLSDEEKQIVMETFKVKRIRKNQYFLQEGDVCKSSGFIVNGAMKQFTIDESGKEDVLGLYIENWWTGDRESFMNGTPSFFNIQATEDTEILVLTKEDFLGKLQNKTFLMELAKTLTERSAFQLLKRIHTTKTKNAEQRLADLQETYPQFFQKFPMHIIASYLGMTKETMSRIRSQSIKGK